MKTAYNCPESGLCYPAVFSPFSEPLKMSENSVISLRDHLSSFRQWGPQWVCKDKLSGNDTAFMNGNAITGSIYFQPRSFLSRVRMQLAGSPTRLDYADVLRPIQSIHIEPQIKNYFPNFDKQVPIYPFTKGESAEPFLGLWLAFSFSSTSRLPAATLADGVTHAALDWPLFTYLDHINLKLK